MKTNVRRTCLSLLLEHWGAVEALALALMEDRRIEGKHVEQIIDHAEAVKQWQEVNSN